MKEKETKEEMMREKKKEVVISTTQKLHVPWLPCAMQPVPRSRNPLHLLLQRPIDQGEPSLLIKKKPVHCTGFFIG